MMPRLETETDLQRESFAINAIATIHKKVFKKTPPFYKIDYCLVDEKNGKETVKAWVELKGKGFAKNSYPTFYTSLDKYLSVARIAEDTGLPAFLVVHWTDGVFFKRIHTRDAIIYDILWGGRTIKKRGLSNDEEPVIHIPNSDFKPISEMFK